MSEKNEIYGKLNEKNIDDTYAKTNLIIEIFYFYFDETTNFIV